MREGIEDVPPLRISTHSVVADTHEVRTKSPPVLPTALQVDNCSGNSDR